jgi:hypothetical protein
VGVSCACLWIASFAWGVSCGAAGRCFHHPNLVDTMPPFAAAGDGFDQRHDQHAVAVWEPAGGRSGRRELETKLSIREVASAAKGHWLVAGWSRLIDCHVHAPVIACCFTFSLLPSCFLLRTDVRASVQGAEGAGCWGRKPHSPHAHLGPG